MPRKTRKDFKAKYGLPGAEKKHHKPPNWLKQWWKEYWSIREQKEREYKAKIAQKTRENRTKRNQQRKNNGNNQN